LLRWSTARHQGLRGVRNTEIREGKKRPSLQTFVFIYQVETRALRGAGLKNGIKDEDGLGQFKSFVLLVVAGEKIMEKS